MFNGEYNAFYSGIIVACVIGVLILLVLITLIVVAIIVAVRKREKTKYTSSAVCNWNDIMLVNTANHGPQNTQIL